MRALALILALGVAGCASDAPSLDGRWAREGAGDREWIAFSDDGTFTVETRVEYPEAGETFGGTYTLYGSALALTGAEGRTRTATVDGDRLVLEDGTAYVRQP